MWFALFFVGWRISQIVILIPTVGMLAWFVDGFVEDNLLTPTYILLLFIVSTLALAWSFFTLFSYHRSSTNASFVSLVDFCFVGAFIAGVYMLRHITSADCARVERDNDWVVYFGNLGSISGPGFDITVSKPCAMLKACFAFGIMEILMFFFTGVLAWMHGDKVEDRHDRRRSHSRRHSHRSGSHHSHRSRSSHHRRVYV
ncbi:uncharacterized protein DNG_04753 [Cephalotrichum gorgonifer]|uniref:MARVEL domain-containing protein n=1 Tax=Cephalotrichum gorgonifer TaxID=2041049 RepID=A0AAE8MZB5_9PEZI|nr:uncharacterized protein DNG_04753 [Cephalotrichum gorgonifer]